MKKLSMVAIMVLTLVFSLSVSAETVKLQDKEAPSTYQSIDTVDDWFDALSLKITRGIINTCTFWVEIPKSMVVETIDNPITGTCSGFFKGTGLALVRAESAVQDLCTIGTIDDTYTVFDQFSFPYFVWQD